MMMELIRSEPGSIPTAQTCSQSSTETTPQKPGDEASEAGRPVAHARASPSSKGLSAALVPTTVTRSWAAHQPGPTSYATSTTLTGKHNNDSAKSPPRPSASRAWRTTRGNSRPSDGVGSLLRS
jgi:hypothetical protein